MITNRDRLILLVGGYGSGKTTRAIEMMKGIPYKILYGNELNYFDVYSYPKTHGLIIEEVNYKPDTKKILEIINVKGSKIILTSLNEKDVPKPIINRCKKNRLGRTDHRQEAMTLAPNRNIIKCRDKSVYDMTFEWLKNIDRMEVAELLKHNKIPDIQILSWIEPNTNSRTISFADSIKRKWSRDYFYEILALSYNGGYRGRIQFAKRRSYSPVPKICNKLNLKHSESYLVKSFLENEEYVKYALKVLDTDECKILNLKKPRAAQVRTRKIKLEDYL